MMWARPSTPKASVIGKWMTRHFLTASKVMLTVLENIQLADDKDMMVCQDTGLAIYKVLIGNKLAERGLDMVERIDPKEMAKAAAGIAVVTWMAAEMEGPLPR